jgi:hypothetical protein
VTATTLTAEHYLESRIDLDDLSSLLLPVEDWHPYPTVADRTGWNKVPEHLRDPIVAKAERLLDWEWPHIPATLFLEFSRIGNRSNYEAVHFERRRNLITLVLAECLEAKGRFLDQVINGIWAICEESFWGVPAHNRPRFFEGSGLPDVDDHYVDLFAAETGNLLAWTHYLLRSVIAVELPVVLNRIECELQDRLLAPYRERDDWIWLGFDDLSKHPNNWNPWIHSNILAANLLIEQEPDERAATVDKCIRGIDRFLAGYAPDGGCDEGISYWGRAGATLYDALDLLASASDGRIDAFGESLIQEIGRYAYRMHIGGEWYVNFADGTAKADIDADLVYRYGKRIGDEHMMNLGIEASRHNAKLDSPRIVTLSRVLAELFDPTPLEPVSDATTFVRDAWLPGIEVLASHESAIDVSGLYLAAKGGHNGESHNHNDVGAFIVGLDGKPLIIDVGVETYSRKTFSPQRYEIWTMQSGYHNLPTINGQDQSSGHAFVAEDATAEISDERSSLSLGIAGAYDLSAGIVQWTRNSTLHRSGQPRVEVIDTFRLASESADLIWNLMTSEEPEAVTAGELVASHLGTRLKVFYDGELLEPWFERIPVTDDRLRPVWNDGVWRTRLRLRRPLASGTVTMTFVRA